MQAVGTTCFVGFFLPREIPFLTLKFSMSNDSSWSNKTLGFVETVVIEGRLSLSSLPS